MKRHELWRKEYRVRRYMEYLSPDELGGRFRDITTNLTTLTSEGMIGFVDPRKPKVPWPELLTHVLEEYELRGGAPEGGLDGAGIPAPTPGGAPSSQLDPDGELSRRGYLFKYSKRAYLEEAVSSGSFRIGNAAGYRDPSLNSSVQDDELAVSYELLPTDVTVRKVDPETLEEVGTISPTENLKVTTKAATDFYVYCLASSFHHRLFQDFEADACLVIKKPMVFCDRLLVAVEEKLGPWAGVTLDVQYIDPLNPPDGALDVFISKHFRYAYQEEVRLVWLPEDGLKTQLRPVTVKLGPLEDVAELLVLK